MTTSGLGPSPGGLITYASMGTTDGIAQRSSRTWAGCVCSAAEALLLAARSANITKVSMQMARSHIPAIHRTRGAVPFIPAVAATDQGPIFVNRAPIRAGANGIDPTTLIVECIGLMPILPLAPWSWFQENFI